MSNSSLLPGPRFDKTITYSVKAAFFDVDNTLVSNESSELPSDSFTKLAQEIGQDIPIAIASARPLQKAEHIINHIHADGLSILSNGAQIYDGTRKKIIKEWTISLQVCSKMTLFLRKNNITFWINDDGVDHFPSDNGAGYTKQSDIWDMDSERIDVPDYAPKKPLVVAARQIDEQTLKRVNKTVETFRDQDTTTLVAHEWKQADGSFLFDLLILNKEANKRSALKYVLDQMGIDRQNVMAVGDGRNDAVLVEYAGIGVAMGNSAQETLEVATFIAPDRTDDGAAAALEFVKSMQNTNHRLR